MSDLEIVYMMLLEDNIAEVAAWANKQGACVILDDDVDNSEEIIYTAIAATTCSEFVDDCSKLFNNTTVLLFLLCSIIDNCRQSIFHDDRV